MTRRKPSKAKAPREKTAHRIKRPARAGSRAVPKPKEVRKPGVDTRPSEEKREGVVPPAEGRERRFPIVGIGASAGGLEALEDLLRHMPLDTGMAFVVVTHQHPGHASLLPDLLGKCTRMPVAAARNNARLEPNRVYVSPPGTHLALKGGRLRVSEAPKGETPPLPIDFFFRSLAADQKEMAVCIVLSGTGTDGSLGLKAVKGEYGMAMVQEVQSARYAGMPSSAIATTLADYVMPPAAMPEQLVAYAKNMAIYRRFPEALETPPILEQPMQKIFVLIRARTGHDFSSYKPNTMRRRIERRITVHQIKSPTQYVRFLQENPHEIDILFKELLIGVTSFFRDPDAFKSLAGNALPDLVASCPDKYTFRVWTPGCGSGEEAYTIAMLLRECMEKTSKSFDFQVFATDLDGTAIETARMGRYPAGIAVDVPPSMLKRYFVREEATYRVRKEIREMLVFAQQNVIKDPPFTKIDLLSCRNLLIYLNADVQKRLLPIFHYALKPGGVMMLGPSESIGGFGNLFLTVDKKWKIFRRSDRSPGPRLVPETPAEPARPKALDEVRAEPAVAPRPVHTVAQIEKALLSRFAPPSVVVNDRGDIVYIHGRTGAYLEPGVGQPRLNIYDMAREGLGTALASSIRRASAEEQEVVRPRVRVKTNGESVHVDLSVVKIVRPESLRGLLLVTFHAAPTVEAQKSARQGRRPERPESSSRIEELECEVRYTRESLQTTVEELETSNEELKSANEELQSTNEELQSTNEELETSKEEMQSLNEELTTVNAELQSKVDELSRANDDMQNLLNSTDIATVFLDDGLNITRYTEQAKEIVKLIQTDVGRPIGDLAWNLAYERVEDDAREVLRTLGCIPRNRGKVGGKRA